MELTSILVQTVTDLPDVSLAVLIGSRARGDHRPTSDVDLLVQMADPSGDALTRLHERLQVTTGIDGEDLDIPTLAVFAHSDRYWHKAVGEGVVLLDRDGLWPLILADPEGQRLAALRPLDDLPEHERTAAEYVVWDAKRH